MNITDLFGGNGGSQAQGIPTVFGAGDGEKKELIDGWLSSITGVYSTITGTGRTEGPAPSPSNPPRKSNYLAWVIGAALVAGLVWFVTRKSR